MKRYGRFWGKTQHDTGCNAREKIIRLYYYADNETAAAILNGAKFQDEDPYAPTSKRRRRRKGVLLGEVSWSFRYDGAEGPVTFELEIPEKVVAPFEELPQVDECMRWFLVPAKIVNRYAQGCGELILLQLELYMGLDPDEEEDEGDDDGIPGDHSGDQRNSKPVPMT